jgi:hypothetical protein
MHSEKCLNFLLGKDFTASGYDYDQLHKWSNDAWENHHDFIQWLFPLNEPSAHNPNGPVLSKEDYDQIKASPELTNAIVKNYERFLKYAGIKRFQDGLDFFDYRKDFWETPNHNWLRITRVLKSLNLCGLHDKTQEFWAFLKDTPVTDGTKAYWEIAAKI